LTIYNRSKAAAIYAMVPNKTDLVADLHRLQVMIKEKHVSLIKKMKSRYVLTLKKMSKESKN